MNSLSILLYLIYVLSTLSFVLGIITTITIILTAISAAAYFISFEQPLDDEKKENATWWSTQFKTLLKVVIIVGVIWVVIPNDRTVKLIAASEVAEYLINTDPGQQVLNDAGKSLGKSGEIINDSLELLHMYITKELIELTPPPATPKSGESKDPTT